MTLTDAARVTRTLLPLIAYAAHSLYVIRWGIRQIRSL